MPSPCPLCHTRDECRELGGGMRVDDIVRAAPDGLPLHAIGEIIGVSGERIRQIEAIACVNYAAACFANDVTDAADRPEEATAFARWARAQLRAASAGERRVLALQWSREVDAERALALPRAVLDCDEDDEGEA